MPARSTAAIVLAAIITLLSLSLISAQTSQYLVNGDFETGDETGWTGSTEEAVSISTLPHYGNYSMSIGQVTIAASIDSLSDITAVTLSQQVSIQGSATKGYTLQWSQLVPKSYGLQQFTAGYSVDSGAFTAVTPSPVILPDDVTAYNTFNASIPAIGSGTHAVTIQFVGQSAYGAFVLDDVILSDADVNVN